MVGEKFKTAFENGNIVIAAGAGISKDKPANLPSWWDYNLLLIESIGMFHILYTALMKITRNRIHLLEFQYAKFMEVLRKQYYQLIQCSKNCKDYLLKKSIC